MSEEVRKHQAGGRNPGVSPRIVIYSENTPTGEDLVACLDGLFRVDVASELEVAVDALNFPAAALLVVPADDPEPMGDWSVLLHRALIRGCRVLVLGPTGTDLEDGYRDCVKSYPSMPDPANLHRDLHSLIA